MRLDSDPRLHKNLALVLQIASKHERKLYLVGGYIRDQLLKRQVKTGSHHDFDFAVLPGAAIELAKIVADELQGHFVLLDEANDTARVITEDGACFDFAACVGGSIESDIKRRDFTVNAIAWDADYPEQLIDIVAAEDDLKAGKIRAISEQSFIDDPLRLLRAYRFAALLDFEIESSTQGYIQKYCSSISTVAAERINSEFFLMLETSFSAKHVKAMGENGLLESIFPELRDCRRVTSNAYHHLGLFEHSLETLAQAERVLPEMPDWAKDSLAQTLASGVSRAAATKLAGLIHDIGKPETWVINPEGKHTFIGHDKLGAEMIEPLAKRLKWAKPIERFIEKLVRWHLRPGHLFQQGPPTDKAKYRFYKTIGEELPELIVLALADFRSTCGPGLQDGRREAEEKLFELLHNFTVYQVGTKKESRFIDGSELMKLLGIKPGPQVGEILDELLEAQSLGEVRNPEEAADLARKIYQEKYCR
ncbi:MAG: HD domain-containing protein [Candidatus Obscuribacterales bacterium]|nr:HD domain-containing protein [Candidatus Obscuribacterales bacterium]